MLVFLFFLLLSVSDWSPRWMLVGFQPVLGLRTISLSRFLTVKVSDLNYMRACMCERVRMCRLGPGGLSVSSQHVLQVSFTSNYPLTSFSRTKLEELTMLCYAAIIFSAAKNKLINIQRKKVIKTPLTQALSDRLIRVRVWRPPLAAS